MKATIAPLAVSRCTFVILLLVGLGVRVAATVVSGELKQWHKVTLTLDGPQARETDTAPSLFTDCNLTVTFTHESGAPSHKVPGYFAADGNAAETSASSGNQWRAHLAPDKAGTWKYSVSFMRGEHAALDSGDAVVKPFDSVSGSFKVCVASADMTVTGGNLAVSLALTNTGIAPFYYDSPVELAAKDAAGNLAATWETDWRLTAVQPAAPAKAWRFQADLRALRAGAHTMLLRVRNPLNDSVPLRFANQTQDQHRPGWLTLGEFRP